jgi:hypothetical protein
MERRTAQPDGWPHLASGGGYPDSHFVGDLFFCFRLPNLPLASWIALLLENLPYKAIAYFFLNSFCSFWTISIYLGCNHNHMRVIMSDELVVLQLLSNVD